MNKISTSFYYTVIILFIALMPLKAEYLFLKDGSIIKGKVVTETASDIIFQDDKNKTDKYQHKNIMRVLYTELNMGKMYIQLKSGDNFRGYMVDEDRDNYIFRYDIYKPQEFTVKRSDVLFIAERNPSGLKGKSGYTDIALTWFLPYDKMKYFNVYYKKKDENKYVLSGVAGSNSYKLKDLNCNTKYNVRVTGVDDTGFETPPSNEIEITTYVKVNVRLKTGKEFKSNLVSEDAEKYIFRDDLDKIKDFTIKRADVQFITERYPSGLTGIAGTDSIKLSWFEPYDSITEYRIYVKKPGEEYKLSAAAGNNSYTLKNLKGNTKYFIKVTGIAKNKTETPPSNEIAVSTLNRPPSVPAGLKIISTKTGETNIEWKPSVDLDGHVVKYNIYKIVKNKKELIGETKDTSYKIPGKETLDKLVVTAVDNMGAESAAADKKDKYSITFTPGIILPFDRFGAMADVGYGGTLSFMWQNLFIQGYILGFEIGYYYIPGKNALALIGQNIHWFNLATAAVKTGYVYKFNSFLFITGTVSIGAAYMDSKYTFRDKYLVDLEKSAIGCDALTSFGLSLDFMITDNFFLGINAGYGLLFESKAVYQFLTFGINIGARF